MKTKTTTAIPEDVHAVYSTLTDQQLRGVLKAFWIDHDAANMRGDVACANFCQLRMSIIADLLKARADVRRYKQQEKGSA